jgi:hypothetical protein
MLITEFYLQQTNYSVMTDSRSTEGKNDRINHALLMKTILCCSFSVFYCELLIITEFYLQHTNYSVMTDSRSTERKYGRINHALLMKTILCCSFSVFYCELLIIVSVKPMEKSQEPVIITLTTDKQTCRIQHTWSFQYTLRDNITGVPLHSNSDDYFILKDKKEAKW